MKIIFLGTGSAIPTKTRNCQSVAIEQNGNYYIFDCGAPLTEVLTQNDIPLEKVKAVFLSHIHRDHVTGLLTFLCLRAYSPDKHTLTLYTPSESWANALISLVKETAHDKVFNPTVVPIIIENEGLIFDDGMVRVIATLTCHQKAQSRPTYAYKIESKDKRVFITGDLLPDASDFPQEAIVSTSDAVITELHHFGPSTLFPLLKDCPTKNLLIIHIDECNRELFEQATNEFTKNATCPKDGDIYVL